MLFVLKDVVEITVSNKALSLSDTATNVTSRLSERAAEVVLGTIPSAWKEPDSAACLKVSKSMDHANSARLAEEISLPKVEKCSWEQDSIKIG